ncbi:putative receptor-like protein kinase At3g47110 [Rhododendron vialii]|uniref:putative receptor-like protein kinase At3g47110 n=1 Tax=Rhododendron vialii TaxID=182163 RepID=UPI00265F1FBD|nr:putative receptor-like protein kinase At3g47110 [Rhododendron vialii]
MRPRLMMVRLYYRGHDRSLHINLNGNNLGGEIPVVVSSLPSLTRLGLAQNNFRGSIPASIGNLSALSMLSLAANKLIGSIPFKLGRLFKLQFLQLSFNNLTGMVPTKLYNMSSLRLVSLAVNQLHGSLAPDFGLALPKLQERNNLSEKIPSSIRNLSQLSILVLAENKLEERIPYSLGNFNRLLGLDLSFNNLTGTIPGQIFGLSSLAIGLFLDGNQLTGPMPTQIGNLRILGKLDLSENKLSGGIPETLSSFQVLEFLSLAGNHFEGNILESLNQLKGIQFVDLSRNNLSGQIPEILGELTSSQSLNLSYNMFEGEVPNNGLFKNISAFSVVGNSKLCGGVEELLLPACPAKELQKKKGPLNNKVIIPVITMSFIVAMILCVATIIFRIKRSRRETSSANPFQSKFPKLSYAELHQATNGFSSNNLIGEGEYGFVYKGILNSTGQTVAVKVLKLHERGGNKSFQVECEALKNIRHRNLVKIITSCSSTDFKRNDFKAFVFEFMENGSLDNWLYPGSLHEQQRTASLNLIQRVNIAIDVASALDYLHYH